MSARFTVGLLSIGCGVAAALSLLVRLNAQATSSADSLSLYVLCMRGAYQELVVRYPVRIEALAHARLVCTPIRSHLEADIRKRGADPRIVMAGIDTEILKALAPEASPTTVLQSCSSEGRYRATATSTV